MTTTEIKEEPGITVTPQNDDSTSNVSKTTTARKSARVEPVYDHRDKETFYKDLISFHENRSTPITRIPKINGLEVDLHKLYGEVISKGGWLKVNIRNEWEQLLPVLGLKHKCVNASVALKHIYTRYLDKFERANFLGEDPDKNDDPEEEGRHKKWSSKSFHSVPMTYNYNQHNVAEQVRVIHKLSTDLYKGSEYEKLLLSLMSPLPNEQDFAINVCTLMANESKHTLKVDHCPKLLDALIAHAGVYCHFSMRDLFYELYTKIRHHSLQSFWNDLLHDKPQILELSYDDYFQSPEEKFVVDTGAGRPPLRLPPREEFQDGLNATREDLRADVFRLNFLALGRGLGTHDYIGQRVNQVSSIIRNLSFFEENAQTLAKNRTFIRFLVMCSNIRWGNIHHMALDVCGNIATELELSDPTSDDLTRCLMSTVCEGLEGHDRGIIISSLEILYKLSQRESNDEHIHKCLDQKVYNQICLFLSLNDIMLLLYTLECIYALSSLGHRSCNQLIQVRGIVDTLVSLITVEAQSYGPDGCVLMRVVETVPGNMLPMVAQNIAKLQTAAMAGQVGDHHMQQTVSQNQQESISLSNSESQKEQISTIENNLTSVVPQPQANVRVVQTSQPATATGTQPNSPQTPNATPVKVTQHQLVQEAEQFTSAWLSANFEVVPSVASRIEQQDLYKMYLAAAQKNGRRCVTQASFPRIVRITFGSQSGPTLVKTTESNGSTASTYYYIRLRARANPLPIQIKTITTPSNSPAATKTPKGSSKQSLKQGNEVIIKTKPELGQKLKQPKKTQMQLKQIQLVKTQIQPGQSAQQSVPLQQSAQIQQCSLKNPNMFQQQSPQSQQILGSQTPDKLPAAKLPGKNIIMNKTTIATPHQTTQQVVAASPGTTVITHTPNQINTMPQHQQHNLQPTIKNAAVIQSSVATHPGTNGNGAASSLIKSLLANKVTPTATEVSESNVSAAPNNPSCLITQNVNMHQVAQRQHLQKQKELAQQQQHQQQQQQQQHQQQQQQQAVVSNIKASTAITLPTTTISALVNNPIIQSPSVKVGQTTIKAINSNTIIPAAVIEKKNQNQNMACEIVTENASWEPVPPSMPVSGITRPQNTNIIIGVSSEDSNSTGNNSIASSIISSAQVNTTDEGEGSEISFEGLLIPKSKSGSSSIIIEDESSKDSINKSSLVVHANQMLADLLDKKSPDPPMNSGIKRKLDDDSEENASKRPAVEIDLTLDYDEEIKVTPSKNAANLYAEMAASILEDEDLEDEPQIQSLIQQHQQQISVPPLQTQMSTQMHQQQQQIQAQIQSQMPHHQLQNQVQTQIQTPVIQKTADAQKKLITMPMPLQRQIIVAPNSPHQMILSQASSGNQPVQTQATATIKTDTGLQTVPLILQKQVGPGGQQIIQPVIQSSQPQTQYVLATNPQGQTYLVAQQPQPTQTVLVTQTPQQQGTPSKTIIILQQQGGPSQAVAAQQQILGTSGTPQKVIMTTPQGQQMIVTQVPRPMQHQIVMNHPTTSSIQTNASQNVVLSQSQSPLHQQHQMQQHMQVQNQFQSQQHIQAQQHNIQAQQHNIQTQQHNIQAQQHIQTQPHQQMQKQIQILATPQVQNNPQQQQQTEKNVLSQLPHIPATIKLHPHQTQNTQTQTIPKALPAKSPVATVQQQQQQQQQQLQTPVPVVSQHQQQQQPPMQQQAIQNHSKLSDRRLFIGGNGGSVDIGDGSQQIPVIGSVTSGTQTIITQPQQQQQQPQSPVVQQSPHQSLTSIPPVVTTHQTPAIIAPPPPPPPPPPPTKPSKTLADIKSDEELIDSNWMWVCDWRNCPRKKFKSLNDVYRHACIVHCPESLDPSAEIYCQWGPGPGLCDSIPRKRFSLMTHLLDRHCTTEAFKAAVQRRIATGIQPSIHTTPVTIIKNAQAPVSSAANSECRGTASPALSTSSTSSLPPAASAAMHAIKRHTSDFANPKELMDENEGPVTKSIRLTAALILRNLVTYTTTAKKNVRCYEPHLAGVALSNVESSQAISQILYEMNN